MILDILGLCQRWVFSGWRGRFLPSIPDLLQPVVLIGGAISVGVLGWSGYVLALPLAMTFPMLWAFSRSRATAALVSAGYFLAASRGLPQGVASFYASDLWPGFLLWIVAALSFVIVHAVLWTDRSDMEKALRYAMAAALMAFPPFGIAGWAHPVTAAGVVFPGWGWVGFSATATCLLVMTTRWWPIAVSAILGFWLWSALTWTNPGSPGGWRGVDLELGKGLGRDASLEQQHKLVATAQQAAGDGARIVVLPESALGFLTPTVERFWQGELARSNTTVIAGAAALQHMGYDNVLVAISGAGARILYRERMPVPVSMWQPWLARRGEGGGAQASFFANPTVEFDGQRIAALICYEQLIVWPVLQSLLHKPDMIVTVGNGWWTAGTSIIAIQNANITAWARLFGLPLITAFNTQAKG